MMYVEHCTVCAYKSGGGGPTGCGWHNSHHRFGLRLIIQETKITYVSCSDGCTTGERGPKSASGTFMLLRTFECASSRRPSYALETKALQRSVALVPLIAANITRSTDLNVGCMKPINVLYSTLWRHVIEHDIGVAVTAPFLILRINVSKFFSPKFCYT